MSQDDVFSRLDKLNKGMVDLLAKMDQIKEAMLLHCDGQDAVNTQLRRNLGASPFKPVTLEQKVKEKPLDVQFKFDMNQIAWTKTENDNGPLEIARETSNDKNRDYFDLKEFLVQGGKGDMHGLAVGEWFCWIFADGDAVGRRLLSVIAQRRSKK